MRRVCKIPGSAEFAERYEARFGPINNDASSYAERVVMSTIEAAAKTKDGMGDRADVLGVL